MLAEVPDDPGDRPDLSDLVERAKSMMNLPPFFHKDEKDEGMLTSRPGPDVMPLGPVFHKDEGMLASGHDPRLMEPFIEPLRKPPTRVRYPTIRDLTTRPHEPFLPFIKPDDRGDSGMLAR